MKLMKREGEAGWNLLIVGFIILMVAVTIGYPLIQPWWAEQQGKAELAQAEQNRQIAVLEAQAKLESSTKLAQAEVERAKGVAQANQIIGESLKNNEDYLRYLWITDVAGANIDKTVVYVPTETNLPILEANRLLNSSVR
jgi:regulator of protease activity HflC (stomatin/prohibitin superfamily)